jgi:uncharacterized membrane protein YbhN (UPF0104 family)
MSLFAGLGLSINQKRLTIPTAFKKSAFIVAAVCGASITINMAVSNYLKHWDAIERQIQAVKSGQGYVQCVDDLTGAPSQLTSTSRPENLKYALESDRCRYIPK